MCNAHYRKLIKYGDPFYKKKYERKKDKWPDRFWKKVEFGTLNDCWNWNGFKDKLGYGRAQTFDRKYQLAHRISYELLKEKIPDGLSLDHLCRNPSCVNPNHLEPVTHKENVLRGIGPTAKNAKKTHCIRGHLLSKENIFNSKKGYRRCKICSKEDYNPINRRIRYNNGEG